MRRSAKPSLALFHSVNKPTLQLSAPSCPLPHTIYLFTGAATPLALPLFLSLCFFPSFPLFKFPVPRKALHAKWWIQAIREFLPLPPQQQSFLASWLLLCSPNCYFSERLKHVRVALPPGQRAPNVPRPQNCAANGFAEENLSSTVAVGPGQVLCCVGTGTWGVGGGSIAASVGGDQQGYLPSTTGVGPVYCFTFGSRNWKCSCLRGVHVGFSTVWRTFFHFFFVLFPTFLPTLTFILIIVFIPDSILVDFLYHSPLQYLINFDFCVTAIHQRLESDGTERVEGSMTQRLENILNSKNLLI